MCPISGGNWNDASNAGVWALNLNNARDTTNDNVGFRADSISPHRPRGHRGIKGDAFRRVTRVTAKSAGFRLSGRTAKHLGGLEGQAT